MGNFLASLVGVEFSGHRKARQDRKKQRAKQSSIGEVVAPTASTALLHAGGALTKATVSPDSSAPRPLPPQLPVPDRAARMAAIHDPVASLLAIAAANKAAEQAMSVPLPTGVTVTAVDYEEDLDILEDEQGSGGGDAEMYRHAHAEPQGGAAVEDV